MSDELKAAIERSRHLLITREQLRELEISFAYGAVHFENPSVTREMVINALPPLDDHLAAALIPRP
jgi:hypothetical protein